MKFNEIESLSKTELQKKIKAAEADLFQAKLKNSIGQLANPMEIRSLRKTVAKLQTALTKKVAR